MPHQAHILNIIGPWCCSAFCLIMAGWEHWRHPAQKENASSRTFTPVVLVGLALVYVILPYTPVIDWMHHLPDGPGPALPAT